MRQLNIQVVLGCQVEAITDTTVMIKGRTGIREVLADTVVLAMGIKDQSKKVAELESSCADVYVLGDCAKAGRIRDAVREGDLAGRLV